MTKKAVVFYHSPCTDGFGAAWAFWKRFGKDADYQPLSHTEFGRFMDPQDPLYHVKLEWQYELIVFVDICPGEVVLSQLTEYQVLDHHATAIKHITDPEILSHCLFNIEHSGAILAWNYCFPNKPAPLLLRLIEDRDLWRFNLEHTAEYLAMLGLADTDFDKWDHFAYDIESEYGTGILAGGQAIIAYERHKQKLLLTNQHTLTIAGHELPALTTSLFMSDLGNEMAKTAPAGVTYYRESAGGWYISLRSEKTNPQALDVSVLAEHYGGGGHKHAAGFRINDLKDL